ncbi:MAG: hypothetical protein MMC33_007099 [Icmadophila ericetorum]|nr:hypothetical protein [Icmadophila ericetorum]
MRLRLFSLITSFLAILFGIEARHPSPSASVDLICHTGHAADCYPRTFQPTTFFQEIHDDQDIPVGLHVRINLETGQKEAKINEESNAGGDQILDVALVERPEDDIETDRFVSAFQSQLLLQQTDDQGAIRPPSSDNGEGENFDSSRDILKEASNKPDPNVLLPALDILEDLSHDIYWGLSLVKDAGAVHKLVRLLSLNGSDYRIKASAALVFGTAIQNNPAALTAALSHCYNDELPNGPMEAVIMALLNEQMPQLLTRFMYLLSALSQDQAQLLKFMKADGMTILINLFDAKNAGLDGKDRIRLKIANFVLDHFLQPDLHLLVKDKNPSTAPTDSKEVETKLANEDAWEVVSKPEDSAAETSPTNIRGVHSKSVQIIKPWCSAFAQSLSSWKKKNGHSSVHVEHDGVRDAYVTLQEKLGSYGSTCEEY